MRYTVERAMAALFNETSLFAAANALLLALGSKGFDMSNEVIQHTPTTRSR